LLSNVVDNHKILKQFSFSHTSERCTIYCDNNDVHHKFRMSWKICEMPHWFWMYLVWIHVQWIQQL